MIDQTAIYCVISAGACFPLCFMHLSFFLLFSCKNEYKIESLFALTNADLDEYNNCYRLKNAMTQKKEREKKLYQRKNKTDT